WLTVCPKRSNLQAARSEQSAPARSRRPSRSSTGPSQSVPRPSPPRAGHRGDRSARRAALHRRLALPPIPEPIPAELEPTCRGGWKGLLQLVRRAGAAAPKQLFPRFPPWFSPLFPASERPLVNQIRFQLLVDQAQSLNPAFRLRGGLLFGLAHEGAATTE